MATLNPLEEIIHFVMDNNLNLPVLGIVIRRGEYQTQGAML